MDTVTILGSLGALLILIAFVLVQTHRWKDTSIAYDATNLVGGALLVVYAVLLRAWPFAVLNGIWTLVSLRDTVKDLGRPRKKSF